MYQLIPSQMADLGFVYETRCEALHGYARLSLAAFDEAAEEERFRKRFDSARHQIIISENVPVGFLELGTRG